jgi:hypothetical protein
LRPFALLAQILRGGLSAQTLTLIGETNPCKGESYDYTFSWSGAVSCDGPPCTANGVTYSNEIQYEWSCERGQIQSQNASGVNVTWYCPSGGNKLRCDAFCVKYNMVEVKDNDGNVVSRSCLPSKTLIASRTLTIMPKCPPSSVNITGPTYIPCCDNGSYAFSAGVSSGDYNYEWISPNGWTINSGQGTASVLITPTNGPNGVKLGVTVWPKGCDKTLSGKTVQLTINRLPQLAKSGIWPNVICSTGTVTLCTNVVPCATYKWTDTSMNFKQGAKPILNNRSSNSNCYTFTVESGDPNDNYGYVDINLEANTPCGKQTLSHRILVPAKVPALPQIAWDGELGYLCVCRRNVLFWTTNDDPSVDDWEWTFDNDSSTYTLNGQMIGTDFCDFGTAWAANPNSDVTVKLRTRNACGWSEYKTMNISAARFRKINSADCNQYPAGPAPLSNGNPEKTRLAGLQITPNPTVSRAQIDWAAEQVGDLWVYDLNGRKVKEFAMLVSGSEISLSGVLAGTYIIKVRSGNQWYVNRLMVQ